MLLDWAGRQICSVRRAQSPPIWRQLDAEVKKNDLPGQNFVLGDTGEFEVSGCLRPVRCWSISPTPWLDAQATAFIAVPELNATVLISFTAWKDDKNRINAHDIQRLILNTLTITPRP